MGLTPAQKFYSAETVSPIYFFFGNEPYLIEDAVARVHHLLFGSFNLRPSENLSLEIFYGSARPVQAIFDSTQSFGLFSQQKLILIKEAQLFRDKDFQVLNSVIENSNDGTTIVFVADGSLQRNKFFKTLSDIALSVEFKTPYEREFPQWINYLAKKNQLSLAPQVSHVLLQLLGTNLQLIDNELKKLSLSKGPNASVRPEDISEIVAGGKEESVFEFTNAFGVKNLRQCMSLLPRLLEQGQSAVSLVSLLARHLRILMEISTGGSSDLGIPAFFMKQYKHQAHSWNRDELASALMTLRSCEKDLKSVSLSSAMVIEGYLVNTLT